jgi:hypothetical protein
MSVIKGIFIVVFFQLISGCDFSGFTNKQYIKKSLPSDVFIWFDSYRIFDENWQGTQIVVHGIVLAENFNKFIEKFDLVPNKHNVDFIKGNFYSYEEVELIYRSSEDPLNIYSKHGESRFKEHRYAIYFDRLSGGTWIVIFENAKFGQERPWIYTLRWEAGCEGIVHRSVGCFIPGQKLHFPNTHMQNKSLTLIILAGLFATVALASDPHRSEPFGIKRVEIPSGISILAHIFIGSASYQGPVGSVSAEGDVLGLSNLQSIPHPAYIHVLSGIDEGMVSTILDADSLSVVLETPLNVVAGDLVAIRKHTTIGEFFAGVVFSGEATLVFYNADGTQTHLNYFPDEWHGWYETTTWERGEDYFFRPGEGIVLNAPHSVTVTTVGAVTVHPIALAFGDNGYGMIGTLNPMKGVRLDALFDGVLVDNDELELFGQPYGYFDLMGWYIFDSGYGGWYDRDNLQMSNHVEIASGNAGALRSQQSNYVFIPPAFTE